MRNIVLTNKSLPCLVVVSLLAYLLAIGCGESSSSSESDAAASSRSSSTDEDTTRTTTSDDALATDQDVTVGPLEDSSADQTECTAEETADET